MMYQRTLKPQFEEAMKHFPVVLLTGARLYYLRTADNQEVDFVIERGNQISNHLISYDYQV